MKKMSETIYCKKSIGNRYLEHSVYALVLHSLRDFTTLTSPQVKAFAPSISIKNREKILLRKITHEQTRLILLIYTGYNECKCE